MKRAIQQLLQKAYQEDDGMLSFEWVLMITLLVIGVVAGLSGARDAIISEYADTAAAATCLNQSYQLDAVEIDGVELAASSTYTDEKPTITVDRQTLDDQQDPENE